MKDVGLNVYYTNDQSLLDLEFDNGKFSIAECKVRIWITKVKRNVIKIATIDQAILLNINTCQFKKTKR